jgi:hypothetical protein
MKFLCTRIFLAASIVSLVACDATVKEISRRVDEGYAPAGAPTMAETASALRLALSQGVESATGRLGRKDGFNAANAVRIPVPQDLRKTEEILRKLGQGRYVDDFVTSLNRAAEQAVPEASAIFATAIRQLTISDAVNIIKGPEDAATRYFQQRSTDRLRTLFRPVVSQATDSVGVTRTYKNMLGKAGSLHGLLSEDAVDLDGYVTGKAIDGLFLYISEEEKRIRENPLVRGAELLQTVFSYYLDS